MLPHIRPLLVVTAALLLSACAGTTPIHRAAEQGDLADLDRLLTQGESPNKTGSGGRTPLHEAARQGHVAALERLVERGARIDARSGDGRTPLMLAADKGRSEIVARLLELGANPDASNERGRTALMLVAKRGHYEVAKLLLAAGADVAARDRDRDTAILLAAEDRHLEIVDLLLEHGAPPGAPDRNGRTPLLLAVDRRDREITRQLLEHGADPNTAAHSGQSPLIKALENQDDELVELLLEHQANPDTTNNNGDPALLIATRRRDRRSVELLLEAKAKPDVPDRNGSTALVDAVAQRDTAIAELLLEAQANPNVRNQNGESPLYTAVQNRHLEMAETLLEHGAKPDLPNRNGARPLVVALNNRDQAMAELLLESGAAPAAAGDAFKDPAGFIAKYGYKGLVGAALANASEAARQAANTPTDVPTTPAPSPPRPGTKIAPTTLHQKIESGARTQSAPEQPRRAAARSPYSRRVAVVVGIDDYASWPSLEGARRDAGQVSEAFRGMGFDEVIELYDREATRRRILTVLGNELAQRTDSDSMAVIYFAGHGQTESLADGGKRGYIVPADSDPNQVFATAISMDTLRSISSRLPARQVYYAMDSCYSGLGLARGIAIAKSGGDGYIEKITSLPTVQMITAGAEGEQAIESGGQGIFTRFFLRALAGEADFDRNGWVTASEIGTYVRPNVTSASHRRQTPRFGTLEGSGEVAFSVLSRRTFDRETNGR